MYAELNYVKEFYSNYSTHSHETLALGILEQGVIEVQFHKQSKQNVVSNNVIVFNPNQVHRTKKVANNSQGYYTLHINTQWCKKIQEKLFGNQDMFIDIFPNIIEDTQIVEELLKLYQEIIEGKNSEKYEKKVKLLLTNIFKNYCDANSPSENKEDNLILLHVEQYILDNVNNQITTEDIAKEVNYSEAYITRIFKKKFGLSPHAFLVNQKINAAKNKLLNSKNQDISQLAVEVGFYDQSHFTNTFKRYFSLTPKQYQKGE